MGNYYGLASTSAGYTKSLKIDAGLSGVIQAATPIAAICGGFIFNYLTKANKYRKIYFLSLSFLIFGNFFYFIAETVAYETGNELGGLIILVIGRMTFGIGGSRLVTRKFLAINVDVWA